MAITIVAPPFDLAIDPTTPLNLFVTATVHALERVIVLADMPGHGRVELVHDGDEFTYFYEVSTRVAYTDPMSGGVGFSYVLKRRGGWIDAVTNIHVIAYDVAGGEAKNY